MAEKQKFKKYLERSSLKRNEVEKLQKASFARFRKDANKINNPRAAAKRKVEKSAKITVGKLFLFQYRAKWEDTEQLPFYDRFPMSFIFSVDSKSFKGINLHYAPIPLRAAIFDNLIEIRNNSRFDESTRLKLSWNVLKSLERSDIAKAIVKMYLGTQIRSEFLEVPSEYWFSYMFLPVAKWHGATERQVFRDTRSKI